MRKTALATLIALGCTVSGATFQPARAQDIEALRGEVAARLNFSISTLEASLAALEAELAALGPGASAAQSALEAEIHLTGARLAGLEATLFSVPDYSPAQLTALENNLPEPVSPS